MREQLAEAALRTTDQQIRARIADLLLKMREACQETSPNEG